MKIINIKSASITYWGFRNHYDTHYNANQFNEHRKFLVEVTDKFYDMLMLKDTNYTHRTFNSTSNTIKIVVINEHDATAHIFNENATFICGRVIDATLEEQYTFKYLTEYLNKDK